MSIYIKFCLCICKCKSVYICMYMYVCILKVFTFKTLLYCSFNIFNKISFINQQKFNKNFKEKYLNSCYDFSKKIFFIFLYINIENLNISIVCHNSSSQKIPLIMSCYEFFWEGSSLLKLRLFVIFFVLWHNF